ncbi:hypothetical protein QTP88_010529 [Uroleucon formosanum]
MLTKLHKSGRRNVASVLNEALRTPKRASKIKRVLSNYNKLKPVPYSPAEALAFLIENKLTKEQYINIRIGSKKRNCNIYPSYEILKIEKKKCYPDNINVTEISCEIPLQDLLNHTTKRILQIPTIKSMEQTMTNLEIIYKWGCDGSSGQAQYNQNFSGLTSSSTTDSDLFMFSLVPLKLQCSVNQKILTIWQNPTPSSTRFCRPIKFMLKKETKENTLLEVADIEKQIKNLIATNLTIGDKELQINHKLIFSMVDGKVCNSMTETSSQTCYICGVTPKNSNNIDELTNKKIKEDNLKFGLSSLHAWIRFFECLLHIAYRLDFKTWQVKQPEHKAMFSAKKALIQSKFRSEMGLLVDVVLQGHGTTNNGNTTRKFFKYAFQSSEITGINLELITRFGNILSCIASGYKINTNAFENYGIETARIFIKLYPWFYMPPSVHKILIHGADVIRYAILPIGQLSEEAQESRNKDYKTFRKHNTRKMSRINTNTDLLHILLVSSDPLISSTRKVKNKNKLDYSPEVQSLFILSDSDSDSDSDTESDSKDSTTERDSDDSHDGYTSQLD